MGNYSTPLLLLYFAAVLQKYVEFYKSLSDCYGTVTFAIYYGSFNQSIVYLYSA